VAVTPVDAGSSDGSDSEGDSPRSGRRGGGGAASRKGPTGKAAAAPRGRAQPLRENRNVANVVGGERAPAARSQPRRAARTQKAMVDEPDEVSSESGSEDESSDSESCGSAAGGEREMDGADFARIVKIEVDV